MSSFLEGVKYYPSGDTFNWKICSLEVGKVSLEELQLMQYASLFNIVMFEHDTLKSEELETLRDELNNLEHKMNIKYVDDKKIEHVPGTLRLRETEGKRVSRDRFVENRIAQYKQNYGQLHDQEELSDAKMFASCCNLEQRDNFEYSAAPMGYNFGATMSAERFSIEHNGGKIDLDTLGRNYGNTSFLAQIMSGQKFSTYDAYNLKTTNYGSMDLYRLAKNAEVKLAKSNEVEGEKPNIDLTALRTIASRQRKDKVKETFNKLKSNIYQFLHPKKDKDKEQDQNQEF